MKIKVEKAPAVYMPKTLTLTFETEQDEYRFASLMYWGVASVYVPGADPAPPDRQAVAVRELEVLRCEILNELNK